MVKKVFCELIVPIVLTIYLLSGFLFMVFVMTPMAIRTFFMAVEDWQHLLGYK